MRFSGFQFMLLCLLFTFLFVNPKFIRKIFKKIKLFFKI